MTIDGSSAPWRRIVGASAVGLVGLAACNLGANPVVYDLADPEHFDHLDPKGVASGDVDEDGDLDLVVVGQYGLGVLANDGSGTYVQDVDTRFISAASPSLADIDGDGDLDLLSTVDWQQDQVPGIWRGDGSGQFATPEIVAPNPPPGAIFGLVPSDVDGDDDIDLLVPVRIGGDRQVGVYLNDGTGVFAPPTTYPLGIDSDSGFPTWLVAGDLDEDGDDDVVAAYTGEAVPPGGEFPVERTMVAIALNDGAGAYTATGTMDVSHTGFVYALQPTLTDLDSDGHLDLAVGGSRSITTALGDGAGGFAAPQLVVRDDIVTVDLLTPADVDGDGNMDLVGLAELTKGLVIYGDGAGGVDDTHPLGAGIDSVVGTDVITTDIEADGDPDIVFAGGTLGVVENAVDGRPHH